MTDNDLSELRSFRAALDEPAADGFARVRRRLTVDIERGAREPAGLLDASRPGPDQFAGRLQAVGVPRRRSGWLLASAGAAAAVTVVIAAVALGLPRTAPSDGQRVGAPPAVDPLVTAPASAELAATWSTDLTATVERLATLAGALQPITVPAGAVLHTGSVTQQEGDAPGTHEVWYEVEGAIALRIRRTGSGALDQSLTEAEIAEARNQLADPMTGLILPTTAYLASLPTDPVRLLQEVMPAKRDKEGKPASEFILMKEYVHLFYYLQPVLSPQLRQAFYRTFLHLSGARSLGAMQIGGRPYVVIGRDQANGEFTSLLLFDPASGRVAGDGRLTGDRLTYIALWDDSTLADRPVPATTSQRTKPNGTTSGNPKLPLVPKPGGGPNG